MPIKLIPPRPGKTPYWAGRGKHLGRYVDRSTKARTRALAVKVIRQWQREIERSEFSTPGEPTFAGAVVSYLKNGGDLRPTGKLLEHFIERDGKPTRLDAIDQAVIDACAIALYPDHSPATRNREVYTPISAILKAAGHDFKIRRPRGSRGRVITDWSWPEQAFRVFDAAKTLDAEFAVFLHYLCYTGSDLRGAAADLQRVAPDRGFCLPPRDQERRSARRLSAADPCCPARQPSARSRAGHTRVCSASIKAAAYDTCSLPHA